MQVWDSESLTTLATLVNGHLRRVPTLTFVGRGKWLFSTGGDDMRAARLWGWKSHPLDLLFKLYPSLTITVAGGPRRLWNQRSD